MIYFLLRQINNMHHPNCTMRRCYISWNFLEIQSCWASRVLRSDVTAHCCWCCTQDDHVSVMLWNFFLLGSIVYRAINPEFLSLAQIYVNSSSKCTVVNRWTETSSSLFPHLKKAAYSTSSFVIIPPKKKASDIQHIVMMVSCYTTVINPISIYGMHWHAGEGAAAGSLTTLVAIDDPVTRSTYMWRQILSASWNNKRLLDYTLHMNYNPLKGGVCKREKKHIALLLFLRYILQLCSRLTTWRSGRAAIQYIHRWKEFFFNPWFEHCL